ncbi:MAG TPA: prepilin-type N-terminal cleavage/methylation domain-containing protein [Thermoanaerobaculia bacterium]|nr:prepilin-type N-terminal cleavage/methylation domain-containing protein [Thermoanaerobaculia bacterium]
MKRSPRSSVLSPQTAGGDFLSEDRGPRIEDSEKGFTLMEIVVSLSIFGTFIIISALLTKEMMGYEKKLPIDFLANPQVSAVISRLRRDVEDATAPYYPDKFENYTQTESTLILYSLDENNQARTIVWDFTDPSLVRRRAYNVGILANEWVARGLPKLSINAYEVPDHAYSVRVQAVDQHGILAIDQIFQPRPHE